MTTQSGNIALRWRLFVVGLALILQPLGLSKAYAQTTGTILGTIVDARDAAVVAATVTVTHVETNLTRQVQTDESGTYRISLLPIGRYNISVEATGFKTHKGVVELDVEQNLRADVRLDVGAPSEEVLITAEAPLVDTTTATLGKVVEGKQIVDLPLNGRNFLQLGVLQAGVTPPVAGVSVVGSGTDAIPGGTAFNFSVHGMRTISNNHLLDGANNVEPVTGAAMIVPSPDTIAEFRILTNMYNAEFGRSGGSIVTVLTKSGTNRIHGTVYEFLRNDIFDARNFFADEVPTLKQNQFGFTLGGPIVENRTFIFGGYEGFRQRRGIPTVTPVPTLLVRTGDFSQEAVKPVDFFTGERFPNDVIPPALRDPLAAGIFDLWPVPNLGDNLFAFVPVAANDRNQFIVRVDHRMFSDKNSLAVRYGFDEGDQFNPNGHFADNAAPFVQVPGFENEDDQTFQNLLVLDSHVFSQTLINELRFSYQRARVTSGVLVGGFDRAAIGFTYPIASANDVPPSIGVSGLTGLGPPFFSQRLNNFYQIADNVSWTTGEHAFKFGADIRRIRIESLFPSQAGGGFNFNGIYSGNAQADIWLGVPFFFFQAGGKEDKTLTRTVYYFYGQDEWRVHRRLTLSLGLRYELVPGFKEKDDLLLTYIQGRESQVSPGLPGGFLRPGDPGISDTLFPTEKDLFAPRVGIAWDVFGDGTTSVRGGYGIFYDESSLVQTYNVYQSPDFQPLAVVVPLFQIFAGLRPSLADPYLGQSPFTPPLDLPVDVGPDTFATWFSSDFKMPYIQHWNLTVQRQITPTFGIEVAYVGNKGTRLQGNVDTNQPLSTPDATPENVNQRRPFFPFLTQGALEISSVYNSNYHGLEVTATQRPANGLSFQAAYTWSKAIDGQSAPSPFFLFPGQQSRAQNNRRLDLERGLSAYDLRHRFVVSTIYEFPFFADSDGFTRAALADWRFTGIFNAQSGRPFTVVDSGDPNGDQTDGDRPNLLRDPNLPSDQQTPERWFDTGAFERITFNTFGSAGRNIVFSDGNVNFDMGLAKLFEVTEDVGIEFRWEVFNVFNHANFAVPDNDIASPTFGRVFRTATPERIMQFGLKVQF